jgi:hypothetical protein
MWIQEDPDPQQCLKLYSFTLKENEEVGKVATVSCGHGTAAIDIDTY